MSNLHRSWLKAVTLSFCALIILTVSPSLTRADEVTFDASTSGCFGTACISQTLLGLSFTGSNFSGTSGFGISEDGVIFTNGLLPLSNLGTFTLSPNINNYNGQQFQLRISFNAPGDLIGGQTATLTADLISNRTGLVLLNFDNTPVLFTFEGTRFVGSFQLAVFDLFLSPGGTGILRGEISNAGQADLGGSTVPEPATLGLLAMGLGGLAGFARRRKKREHSSE